MAAGEVTTSAESIGLRVVGRCPCGFLWFFVNLFLSYIDNWKAKGENKMSRL